jgi:hypothetical protein
MHILELLKQLDNSVSLFRFQHQRSPNEDSMTEQDEVAHVPRRAFAGAAQLPHVIHDLMLSQY